MINYTINGTQNPSLIIKAPGAGTAGPLKTRDLTRGLILGHLVFSNGLQSLKFRAVGRMCPAQGLGTFRAKYGDDNGDARQG